ncbi:hypothetical protein [Tenacibaculum maritimum]|uniref:hypothetical protein n=1 Tax=Tenacibaculum maritimum TaxID=107401 RepID=UPI003875D0AE
MGNNPNLYAYVKDSNSWVNPLGLIQIYRLLRPDEHPFKELAAKKLRKDMTVHGHVATRVWNKGSQFISTSIDPDALKKWRELGQRMVSFDTDDVIPDIKGNKRIVGISTIDKGTSNGVGSVTARLSASSREVLVEGHVPSNAIKPCK